MVSDVIVSFGHPPLHTFSLKEVEKNDTLEKILNVELNKCCVSIVFLY